MSKLIGDQMDDTKKNACLEIIADKLSKGKFLLPYYARIIVHDGKNTHFKILYPNQTVEFITNRTESVK